MNYDSIFSKTQEQYEKMYQWMQNIDVCIDVLRENNSIETMKNAKILKRIARIEDKLKIVNIEE